MSDSMLSISGYPWALLALFFTAVGLRQKLEDDPAQPKYLLTDTAVGYRLRP